MLEGALGTPPITAPAIAVRTSLVSKNIYPRLNKDNIRPNNEENLMCAKDFERYLRRYKTGVTILMNVNSVLLVLSTTSESPLPSHLQQGKFYCS